MNSHGIDLPNYRRGYLFHAHIDWGLACMMPPNFCCTRGHPHQSQFVRCYFGGAPLQWTVMFYGWPESPSAWVLYNSSEDLCEDVKDVCGVDFYDHFMHDFGRMVEALDPKAKSYVDHWDEKAWYRGPVGQEGPKEGI